MVFCVIICCSFQGVIKEHIFLRVSLGLPLVANKVDPYMHMLALNQHNVVTCLLS